MKRSLGAELIAGLLILLFIYTSSGKLLDFGSFRHVLSRSPLIGNKSQVVAWVLPITEIIVSVLLFFPRSRRWGLWSSFVLMLIFTGYIAYMLAFAPQLPCSCGGVIRNMTWKQHLVFNIFFTIVALIGIWLHQRSIPPAKPGMLTAAFNDSLKSESNIFINH